MTEQSVVIGIPTFRRPNGLQRLLKSVAKLEVSFPVHVLVADNDGIDRSGMKVVETIQATSFPYPITAFSVPERGISHARNGLMDYAFSKLKAKALAMIDDDERAEPAWLAELVAIQRETHADVVGGCILPEFTPRRPGWTHGLSIYSRDVKLEGLVTIIENAGSVLLSNSVHFQYGSERFNHTYGLIGGEDKEFFLRLKKRGAVFAFAPNSISHERYDRSRSTRWWACKRAFRIGNCDMHIYRSHTTSLIQTITTFTKIPLAITASVATIPLLALFPKTQMLMCLALSRQLGKLYALTGHAVREYNNVHGS
jgi:glycosyltransferase involved in cell wall biosynthesis